MKILFLCTYYHRAMIFYDIVQRLQKMGHEVKVFNAVIKKARIDEKYKGIMNDKNVIHKECFNKWDRYMYNFKQNKIYNALVKSYRVERFDLLHSHNLFNGGYVAYKIKQKYGLPYVVSIRNTDINTFLKIPLFDRIANRIIQEAAGIHFLSIPYKKEFIQKYVEADYKKNIDKKSIVIRNGLENYWLLNKNEKVKSLNNQNRIKILIVGKIDKNKNIYTTIEAAKLLEQKGYNIELTVVGQVLDKRVFEEIQKISFTNILSYQKKEELIKIYRENDIFVMPSFYESFGRVYAEAMTQGLPVIYSKGQGFDGFFEDGDIGYSVPSKDVDYIAKSIIKIIDNYTSISQRCLEYCHRFDWNNISKEFADFYEESVKRK